MHRYKRVKIASNLMTNSNNARNARRKSERSRTIVKLSNERIRPCRMKPIPSILQLKTFTHPVKGTGVQVESHINKHTIICEYDGDLLNEKEMRKQIASHNIYLLQLGKSRVWIDGSTGTSLARYINHSCECTANCFLIKIKTKMFVVSKTSINASTNSAVELSLDYGFRYSKEDKNDPDMSWMKNIVCATCKQ